MQYVTRMAGLKWSVTLAISKTHLFAGRLIRVTAHCLNSNASFTGGRAFDGVCDLDGAAYVRRECLLQGAGVVRPRVHTTFQNSGQDRCTYVPETQAVKWPR